MRIFKSSSKWISILRTQEITLRPDYMLVKKNIFVNLFLPRCLSLCSFFRIHFLGWQLRTENCVKMKGKHTFYIY